MYESEDFKTLVDTYAAILVSCPLLYANCYGQLHLYVRAEGLQNKACAILLLLYTFLLEMDLICFDLSDLHHSLHR